MNNNYSKRQTEESPYSSYYSNSRDSFDNIQQNVKNESNNPNAFDHKKDSFNQFNSNPNFSTASIQDNINQEDDLQTYFIEKAREDMNILPTEYRNKIDRLNKVFVFSSCIYPVYFLANFLKDYPEINQFSKRNLIFSTGIYLGLLIFLNARSNKHYNDGYYHLRSRYSVEQIRTMINDYHDINNQNLLNSINNTENKNTYDH